MTLWEMKTDFFVRNLVDVLWEIRAHMSYGKLGFYCLWEIKVDVLWEIRVNCLSKIIMHHRPPGKHIGIDG